MPVIKMHKKRPLPPFDLVTAAIRGEIGRVAQLLEAGENPNKPDALGRTAINEAIVNGDVEMIELLVHYGADVD